MLAGQEAVAIERTTLVADVEQARDATETERLLSALLSSLSHDLRTPLVSIMGESTSLPTYEDTIDDVSRSEEHTSELQAIMRFSYAVFCVQKTRTNNTHS